MVSSHASSVDRALKPALGFLAAVLLGACGAGGQGGLDPSDYDGVPTCGAENFQSLLGEKESVLKNLKLPKATRILRPEDAIALDFSPDRLTIDVDGFGRISSVTCR